LGPVHLIFLLGYVYHLAMNSFHLLQIDLITLPDFEGFKTSKAQLLCAALLLCHGTWEAASRSGLVILSDAEVGVAKSEALKELAQEATRKPVQLNEYLGLLIEERIHTCIFICVFCLQSRFSASSVKFPITPFSGNYGTASQLGLDSTLDVLCVSNARAFTGTNPCEERIQRTL
jgi:hypothetical protein